MTPKFERFNEYVERFGRQFAWAAPDVVRRQRMGDLAVFMKYQKGGD